MKANKDKDLEKFVDKLMKQASLESPSPEFTTKLMSTVLSTEMDKATVYKPLISKSAWFIILGGFVALITSFLYSADSKADSFFQSTALVEKTDTLLKSLAVIKLSSVSLYAVVLLIVMLFIQIVFLKNYFSSKA